MVKPILRLGFITTCLLILPFVIWRIPAVQNVLANARHWQENPLSWFWFCLFAIIYCSFGLSRQALCFAAGLGFGFGRGLLFCTIAYEVGACLTYSGSRLLGRRCFKGLKEHKKTKLHHVADFCRASPFLSVLALRFLPVGSALLVSVAAGFAELSFWRFAGATMIGGLPQSVIFTLMGAGTSVGRFYEIFLAVLLFLLSSLLGWAGLQRFRQKQIFLKKSSFQSSTES